MKPYGIPRKLLFVYPDMGDIAQAALKSSTGHFPGPGGDCRSNFKNSAAKRATRRHFKRQARNEAREACKDIS